MEHPPVIVWFRNDLRITDHPALYHAARANRPVIPLYIWSPDELSPFPLGEASRWWLHKSLKSLHLQLEKLNSRLLVLPGPVLSALERVVDQTHATELYCSTFYEPEILAQDQHLSRELSRQGVRMHSYNSGLLHEPDSITTQQGTPYRVFTPFYKKCIALPEPAAPLPPPKTLQSPPAWPKMTASAIEPVVSPPEGARYEDYWTPGEPTARAVLEDFFHAHVADYERDRDLPSVAGTSRLGPHLNFGEISVRTIWHTLQEAMGLQTQQGTVQGGEAFLRQLYWREFAYHVLYHHPDLPSTPLRPNFRHFPWHNRPDALHAWKHGQTGFPYIDAGMRELKTTGWMHNRVRMAVASFLVKDLLIPWQEGAQWFWERLLDADLANNSFGWQWVAGCGADAAPYFRIFNPITQGEKFDKRGDYIRRWVPEVARLDPPLIFHPWTASEDRLKAAGIVLGETYPQPIVDHAAARTQALEAYEEIKKQ